MDSDRCCERVCPNVVVISFVLIIALCSLIFIQPCVLEHTNYSKLAVLNYAFTLLMLIMWAWCWSITIAGDPGRISDDLDRRGLLTRIKKGDVPNCLKHLLLCPLCKLPKPPGSHHCEICGACHLRYDHHCGVTGQCVADKNFKAFILSFVYGGIFGISCAPTALYCYIERLNYFVVALILMIYSLMLGLMIFGF